MTGPAPTVPADETTWPRITQIPCIVGRMRSGGSIDDRWSYDGLQVVRMISPHLAVDVLVGKGADIVSIVDRATGVDLMWHTPWGVRNPATNTSSTGDPDAIWLDHYPGGWQCVVPNGGAAGRLRGADLGQHGEVALIPWRITEASAGEHGARLVVWTEPTRYPIRVTRRVELSADRPTVVVTTRVDNLSTTSLPVACGEHLTFGAPLVGPGTEVVIPAGAAVHAEPHTSRRHARVEPGLRFRWPHAVALDGANVDLSCVPERDFTSHDLCYVDMSRQTARPGLWNDALGLGVLIGTDHSALPHLWCWMLLGGGDEYPWWGRGYAIGLEPFAAPSNHGLAAVADGGAPSITRDDSMVYEIELEVVHSPATKAATPSTARTPNLTGAS